MTWPAQDPASILNVMKWEEAVEFCTQTGTLIIKRLKFKNRQADAQVAQRYDPVILLLGICYKKFQTDIMWILIARFIVQHTAESTRMFINWWMEEQIVANLHSET